MNARGLVQLIIPVRVPAKTRLKATIAELGRLVDSMPDSACEALEKTGLVQSWRSQLATLAAVGVHAPTAEHVLKAASAVLRAYQRRR